MDAKLFVKHYRRSIITVRQTIIFDLAIQLQNNTKSKLILTQVECQKILKIIVCYCYSQFTAAITITLSGKE